MTRQPCIVSDRVVYRTLLRSGLERYKEVERALRVGVTQGRSFQEKAWKLVVRYQQMEADDKRACALLGADADEYARFRTFVLETLPEAELKAALTRELPRKIRQFRRDLRQADDFDFFCGGGLNLRDEIEWVRMFLERSFRRVSGSEACTRELELVDFHLRERLGAFLKTERAVCSIGPDDGFRLAPGIMPDRFWWRTLKPSRVRERLEGRAGDRARRD